MKEMKLFFTLPKINLGQLNYPGIIVSSLKKDEQQLWFYTFI